ncbi:hypothetical protein SSX86_007186 [Deinandra increscens subsp. villosa]|uniref:DNA glycosylase n=1 Tax=Deinandra increscens subsp. villosa TaxID=3103831 RepID=A0AAP0DP79_9ASTR
MGWKGSVVDAVVGIIMTQNAADSLSSSAFMSLAAKYPNKIKTESLKDEDQTQVHALDWNAVRTAPCSHIAQAIKRKGMNKRNAERIQNFLNRIHDDKSGLGDLEWLRSAEPEVAKDFFMGIYGLGLKSTECLRLLTLRQHAFPLVINCKYVRIWNWNHANTNNYLPTISHSLLTNEYSGRGLPGETTFADPVTPGRSKGPVLEDIEDLSLGPQSQDGCGFVAWFDPPASPELLRRVEDTYKYMLHNAFKCTNFSMAKANQQMSTREISGDNFTDPSSEKTPVLTTPSPEKTPVLTTPSPDKKTAYTTSPVLPKIQSPVTSPKQAESEHYDPTENEDPDVLKDAYNYEDGYSTDDYKTRYHNPYEDEHSSDSEWSNDDCHWK